jgi:hypothetical protein
MKRPAPQDAVASTCADKYTSPFVNDYWQVVGVSLLQGSEGALQANHQTLRTVSSASICKQMVSLLFFFFSGKSSNQ